MSLAFVGANILCVFQTNSTPQHREDQHTEDGGASTLNDETREVYQMQFHQQPKAVFDRRIVNQVI